MSIIAHFPGDIKSYLDLERWRPPPPETCPLCGARSGFVGHGSYPRYAAESGSWQEVRIPRLKCKACNHTFGVLPDFLIPGRHYSAHLVQLILALRYQFGISRRQLSSGFQGVPALSTCLAWIRAFATRAELWLHAVLRALARFDPGYDPLHWLVSPIGRAHGPPRLLLDLLPQLLVALGAVGQELRVDPAQGLGLLLLWGQGERLPRLL